jgi:hypothetical protein
MRTYIFYHWVIIIIITPEYYAVFVHRIHRKQYIRPVVKYCRRVIFGMVVDQLVDFDWLILVKQQGTIRSTFAPLTSS